MDGILDLSVDTEGVARLTWDMAEAPMNVFSADAITAFGRAVERIRADDGIRGVVIASAKPVFHAGADLNMVRDLLRLPAEEVWHLMREVMETFHRLETCGKPVAAAVNGHALGGGFEMALACHARFVVDDPRIKLGLPEAALGLMPGFGGTQRLTRLMDFRRATKDMIRGVTYTPQEASALGLVTQTVAKAELYHAARTWVLSNPGAIQPWMEKGAPSPASESDFESFFTGLNGGIARDSWGNAPAQRLIAEAVYHGLQLPIEPALRCELRRFVELTRQPTTAAMVRTNFFATKDARALDRRPAGPAPTRLHRIGIIGGGLMGAGIAYVAARAGLAVVLIDVDQAAADKAPAYAARLLVKDINRGRGTEADKAQVLGRIDARTDFAALADCDLVIEAVFEDAALKHKVLRTAEAEMRPDAVLASNTSTIPIGQLAEALNRPDQFLGLHFFSPVEKMPLLEIITGHETSQTTLAAGFDIAKVLSKVPIAVRDGRAFYTTRVVVGYMLEGMTLLAEGVAPALIENAGRQAGMPMGPLLLCDMVHIDLIEKIEAQTEADLGTAYVPNPGRAVAQAMLARGRAGEKAKAGFYSYDAVPARLWSGLDNALARAKVQPEPGAVADRLLYRQAVEVLRCFDDGVLDNARDADLGSVLGWGFAPHTGGIASFIDQRGADKILRYCERESGRLGARFAPGRKLRELAETGARLHVD